MINLEKLHSIELNPPPKDNNNILMGFSKKHLHPITDEMIAWPMLWNGEKWEWIGVSFEYQPDFWVTEEDYQIMESIS